jgi:hypothetical protein
MGSYTVTISVFGMDTSDVESLIPSGWLEVDHRSDDGNCLCVYETVDEPDSDDIYEIEDHDDVEYVEVLDPSGFKVH